MSPRRQTNPPADLLAGRTLDTYCAGLGRLYAALADHTAYPIPVGAGGPTVLQNQAHAEGAAPGSQESARHVAVSAGRGPAGSCVSAGSPATDCRDALQTEEDARRSLKELEDARRAFDEEALRVALMAEQEAEADAAFWCRVWDMAAVFCGVLALLAGAAVGVWGGMGR